MIISEITKNIDSQKRFASVINIFKLLYDSIIEFSIKTKDFGLKPTNYLVFNNPTLKGGVSYNLINLGFSPNY